MTRTIETETAGRPELTAAEMRQAGGGAIWLEIEGVRSGVTPATARDTGIVVPVRIKHGV